MSKLRGRNEAPDLGVFKKFLLTKIPSVRFSWKTMVNLDLCADLSQTKRSRNDNGKNE